MSENKYRKIWIENFGPIPKDEYGKTYHIHHIDGNRENNELTNLKCVSIMEHFNIHYNQKDWGACAMIMAGNPERFSKEFISEIHRKMVYKENPNDYTFNRPDVRAKNIRQMKEKIAKGTFHLQTGEIQSRTNRKLIQMGKHNFQSSEAKLAVSKRNQEQLKNGTHPFLKKRVSINAATRKRVVEGKHHLQSKEHSERMTRINLENSKNGNHNFQHYKTCEHCGFVGRGFGYIANHGKYCLDNPISHRVVCIYCNTSSHPAVHKRYHGEHCKLKEASTTSRKT